MVAIACSMMKNEIELAMKNTGYKGRILWMESGLHSNPHLLRHACQKEIDRCPQEETCLLLYGQCGNGTVGLRCSCARLVIPRFADCIRIALSLEQGLYDGADSRTMYSSQGWNESERSMRADYAFSVAKYGEKRTKRIFDQMLHAYRDFCMMDTGAYSLAAQEPQAKETARLFGLNYCSCKAGTRVYETLLSGNWGEEFVVKTQNEVVTMEDFLDWRV